MKWLPEWQVMTPTTGHGPSRYVKWTIATRYEHDAERMAEQAALELGVTFVGDLEVRRTGQKILAE